MDLLDNALADPAHVAVVLSDDIITTWTGAQSWGDRLGDSGRLVACRWEAVPRVDQIISDVVRCFAETALSDWPEWFGTQMAPDAAGNYFEQNAELRSALQRVARAQLHVLPGWLRRSAEQCAQGQLPFDPAASAELQAGQLALAISSKQLILVLCASESGSDGAAGLIAAGEWFARVTAARVRLIVPAAWRAAIAAGRASTVFEHSPVPAVETPTDPADRIAKVIVHVSALTGRPHPASPAEQLLHRRIQADAALANLLEFNRTIEVDLDRPFRVDIVARAARLVIEIDGKDHRAAGKYCDDCERDYRLAVQGYQVLRLPDELVLADPALAIARIRHLLEYRTNKGIEGGIS